MGRTMPVECSHGRIVDWGDFGPSDTDRYEGLKPCPECATEAKAARQTVFVKASSIASDVAWERFRVMPSGNPGDYAFHIVKALRDAGLLVNRVAQYTPEEK